MKQNLYSLSNEHALDFTIKYRDSFFGFDIIPAEKEDDVFLGFQPLGSKDISHIAPLTNEISMCTGYMQTKEHEVHIIHNPFQPTISVSLCFLLGGDLFFGLEGRPEHVLSQGYSFIDLGKDVSTVNKLRLNSDINSFDIHFSEGIFQSYYEQLKIAGIVKYPLEKYAYTATGNKFFPFKNSPALLTILKQIKNCPYSGNTRTMYMHAKLSELLIVYFDNVNKHIENQSFPSPKVNHNDIDKINYLKEKLSAFYDDRLHLSDLAKEIGMSETDMQVKFKTIVGKTIIQFHREYVLQEAFKLIQSGLPIKNVAFISGYSSIASFSKAFTKFYGFRPSQINS